MTKITKLTKTSNLVLLTILIGVSVTSAYAITITLGADPVNILGKLNVDGDLTISNGVLNLGTPATLTILSEIISPFRTLHTLAAEFGTTANLVHIIGATTGDIIIIKPDTGDTITVQDTGNIILDGSTDIVMDNNDRAGFIFDGTSWNELFRTDLA